MLLLRENVLELKEAVDRRPHGVLLRGDVHIGAQQALVAQQRKKPLLEDCLL